jgi:hypothetical protein
MTLYRWFQLWGIHLSHGAVQISLI